MGIREIKEGATRSGNEEKRRTRPQILPIGQTGSPQKLLTRGLMGKLITATLYSSESSSSPSLPRSRFSSFS